MANSNIFAAGHNAKEKGATPLDAEPKVMISSLSCGDDADCYAHAIFLKRNRADRRSVVEALTDNTDFENVV